jgi:hypothetical protein
MTNIFILPGILGVVGTVLLCALQKARRRSPFSTAILVACIVALGLFIVDWRANSVHPAAERLFFAAIVSGIGLVVSFVSGIVSVGVYNICIRETPHEG